MLCTWRFLNIDWNGLKEIISDVSGHSREATVTLVPIWKRGVSKRGILKSLVSHVLNFKSWIKLIYDKITYIYCVINEFNPTFEVQKMGNEAFQNASFGNASFPNGNEGNSCLWAKTFLCIATKTFMQM